MNRPANYGAVWREQDRGLEWYTWMYKGRLDQHRSFQRWFRFIDRLRPVRSVMELGCGLGVGYADFFKDLRYVGVDLSEREIAWCRANRVNPKHEYVAGDFLQAPLAEKFDVVFSQGTIDNTYDMDAFLQAAAAASCGWVYVTAYRGFFPDLADHVYRWHEPHGCFYNDLSPAKAMETLRACACRDVTVLPSPTGREEIPFETVIVARVAHD